MEMQEPQRYEMVESFLQNIKHAASKQQFLSKVHQFDARFIDDNSAPTMPEKQKSVQKLPPLPQEKPKNPFKTNVDDFRQHAMMQTAQQSPFGGPAPVRGNYHTEQNFYRPPSGAPMRNQPPPQPHHPMTGNYGYPENRNSQSQTNQYGGGGMGVLNYNAFSQKEYDDLKQQFFKMPNMARPPVDPYNRMNQDTTHNFGHLGMAASISSDILPGETSFSKPTPRNYQERVNPFMKN